MINRVYIISKYFKVFPFFGHGKTKEIKNKIRILENDKKFIKL